MSIPLLTTKLYLPPLPQKLVPRPHLIKKLNNGLSGKMTLVSAQAGFGKTTLVSEWLLRAERPFTYLSLDEYDNNLLRFLAYLVGALQKIDPLLGKSAQTVIEASP